MPSYGGCWACLNFHPKEQLTTALTLALSSASVFRTQGLGLLPEMAPNSRNRSR